MEILAGLGILALLALAGYIVHRSLQTPKLSDREETLPEPTPSNIGFTHKFVEEKSEVHYPIRNYPTIRDERNMRIQSTHPKVHYHVQGGGYCGAGVDVAGAVEDLACAGIMMVAMQNAQEAQVDEPIYEAPTHSWGESHSSDWGESSSSSSWSDSSSSDCGGGGD